MTKCILRVFPRRTSYTPDDALVFIGLPPFRALIPQCDEVHVSCTFTWDIDECRMLADAWEAAVDVPVRLGGPALMTKPEGFETGMYIRRDFTFTSRGCNNRCPWCIVPELEGELVELEVIHPGNIIQDNNFLQCSKAHKGRVYDMLRRQPQIAFRGGLDASLLDHDFADAVRGLRVAELWLACDTRGAMSQTMGAIELLSSVGFTRRHIYCYVLIGDDMDENEDRCRAIFRAGAMPRAQLYRDYSGQKTVYSREWQQFERQWQRPAATVAHMKQVANGTEA
jgi:hypothetical protein